MTRNKVTEASVPVTAIKHADKRANIPTEKLRQRRPRSDDLLSLILAVTGEGKKDKAANVSTTCALWVPAADNHGGFGHRAFLAIIDPWDARKSMRASFAQCDVSE